MTAEGIDIAWGHTRTFSNQFDRDFDYGNGINWSISQWAVLGEDSDGTLWVMRGADDIRRFDGTTLAPLFGARDALSHDSGTDKYTFTTPSGEKYVFHGLNGPQPRGVPETITFPGGKTITFHYTGSRLDSVDWPASPGTQGFRYSYLAPGDPNAGRLLSVTMYRETGGVETAVQGAAYTYYDGASSHGSIGDLKQVIVTRLANLAAAYYYRYFTGSPGYPHALKIVIGPAGFARVIVSGLNLDTATDDQLEPYSDYRYLSYDGNRRVTSERTNGGAQAYGYAFTAGSGGANYNEWQMKTVETRPIGGGTRTVYTNFLGQVLLSQLSDGAQVWIDYYQYDADGRLIKHAHPSSVQNFTESSPSLTVNLKNSSGLIQKYAYYTSDTSPAAKGYLQYEAVQQGNSGSEQKLRQYEYGTRTAGGRTVRPVTKMTTFRNNNGTGGIDIAYSYSWHSGTVQMLERTTTLPAVPTAQNGTNTAATRKEQFDDLGRITFTQDERERITAYSYDPQSGALTQKIEDAASGPWTAPSAPLNLTTNYTNDELGRTIEELGPAHDINGTTVRTATWTVYKEALYSGISPLEIVREVWTTQGYKSGSTLFVTSPVAPVAVSRFDGNGRLIWTVLSERDPSRTTAQLDPGESYSDQTRWFRWTWNRYNDLFELGATRVYFNIPNSGAGTLGTNYNETTLHYEDYSGVNQMGRQDGTTTPGGTITRTIYDVRGLPLSEWVGTDATGFTPANPTGSGSNNLRQTRSQVYDFGFGGGDGNLTQESLKVDGTSGNDRVRNFVYDFRSRLVLANGPINGLNIESRYDNLDRIIFEGQANPAVSNTYLSVSETDYDERGQVYRRRRFVTPSTYPSGNTLVDNFWYDAAGNQLQSKPAGSNAWTKNVYDGVGRVTKTYTGYGSGGPDSVSTDLIFEQVASVYDDASNLTFVITKRRYDNAPNSGTGSAGELQDPTTQPAARVTYVGTYYDQIGRIIDSVNWGNNGDASLSRPSTVPGRSDTVLVTTTEYNLKGEAYRTYDPVSATVPRSETVLDDAGRVTQQVQNVVSGGTNYDQNQAVNFTYNADGRVLTMTAINGHTSNQTTTYTYGSTLTESQIVSNDLLREVTYPATTESVALAYNRQGDRIKMTDENGTIHDYGYDSLGRQTSDTASTLGSGIAGGVRRINRAYTLLGLLDTVTSYSNTSGTTVANQVKYSYNELGQLLREYQQHDGPVSTTSPVSLNVLYAYENGSGNNVRRTSVTYPNGRQINYVYSSGKDDNLSRITQINDGSTAQVAYIYLGLSDFVFAELRVPQIRNTIFGSTRYDFLDNFDRVKSLVWFRYSDSTFPEVLNYTFDRVSNRLTRRRLYFGTTGNDEKYTYDGLHRLEDLQRGTLSGSSITNKTFQQNWQIASNSNPGLDPTGNWTNFRQDDDGTGYDLTQTRSHNGANEITGISGGGWEAVDYDDVGNTTDIPQPLDPTEKFVCIYDAWNRLTRVEDDSANLVAEGTYDGLNRRVTDNVPFGGGTLLHHRYYSDQWQVLEERIQPTSTLNINRQFIWGLRYVDDLVRRDRDSNLDGVLDETRFALQDGNFNVTAVVDSSSVIQERYRYDAYGTVTALNPTTFVPTGNPPAAEWETLYAGYRYERQSGLYHVRNRAYHAVLGRWLQRDPLGYEVGLNLYAYVNGRAPSATDWSGLAQTPCCGTEVGTLLQEGLKRVETNFNARTIDERFKICETFRTTNGWDISEFYLAGGGGSGQYVFRDGACGSGTCVGSVTIFGNCYWAAEANYVLWGLANRLCHNFYLSQATGSGYSQLYYPIGSTPSSVYGTREIYSIPGRSLTPIDFGSTAMAINSWRRQWYWSRQFEDPNSMPARRSPGMGIPGRTKWALAGWTGNMSDAMPSNIDNRCSPCTSRYRGGLQLRLGRAGTWLFFIGRGEETIVETVMQW